LPCPESCREIEFHLLRRIDRKAFALLVALQRKMC
jgi:hypothetical protein